MPTTEKSQLILFVSTNRYVLKQHVFFKVLKCHVEKKLSKWRSGARRNIVLFRTPRI